MHATKFAEDIKLYNERLDSMIKLITVKQTVVLVEWRDQYARDTAAMVEQLAEMKCELLTAIRQYHVEDYRDLDQAQAGQSHPLESILRNIANANGRGSVAIKKFRLVGENPVFDKHFKIWRSLLHPHVAQLYGVGSDEGAPFMVYEYAGRQSLDRCWDYLSQKTSGRSAPSCVGTFVLACKTHRARSDVYSFGLTIIEAITKQDPFQGLPLSDILDIKSSNRLHQPRGMNDQAWDLVQQMCLCDPSKRVSLVYVRESLTAWLRSFEYKSRQAAFRTTCSHGLGTTSASYFAFVPGCATWQQNCPRGMYRRVGRGLQLVSASFAHVVCTETARLGVKGLRDKVSGGDVQRQTRSEEYLRLQAVPCWRLTRALTTTVNLKMQEKHHQTAITRCDFGSRAVYVSSWIYHA
ncbi:Protein kinase-like domain [Phytophthora cactorum]|nr:Protein kinase-like domain [Phytophthora cactorum]